METNDQEVDDV